MSTHRLGRADTAIVLSPSGGVTGGSPPRAAPAPDDLRATDEGDPDGPAWSGDDTTLPSSPCTTAAPRSRSPTSRSPTTWAGPRSSWPRPTTACTRASASIVTGERTDIPGTPGIIASELTMVGGVEQQRRPVAAGRRDAAGAGPRRPARLHLRRATRVTINGNVAAATQGATTSGGARQRRRRPGRAGLHAQAGVRDQPADLAAVRQRAGRRGHADRPGQRRRPGSETDDLSQAGPNDADYTLRARQRRHRQRRRSATACTARGCRPGSRTSPPPTGSAAAAAATSAAGQITQLASRPLGVNAVTNPLPTTGGADGDAPADVRGNAAMRVPGAGPAAVGPGLRGLHLRPGRHRQGRRGRADRRQPGAHLRDHRRRGRRARGRVRSAGHRAGRAWPSSATRILPVRVRVRDLLLLVLSAGIKVGADYSYDLVEPAVRAAALAAGGFAAHGARPDRVPERDRRGHAGGAGRRLRRRRRVRRAARRRPTRCSCSPRCSRPGPAWRR